MVCEIMRDEAFLAQRAEQATPEHLPVAQDLRTAQIIQHEIDHCEGVLI